MATSVPFFNQPQFDKRLTTKVFPLTGDGGGEYLQTGYMIWDKPLPGYGSRATIQYLYNPSTVSSDYNIADASAQAALNFPNAGDTAMLAIPLSQTAQWTLMFDRTFEVWNSYNSDGLPSGTASAVDAGTLGCQADVLAFMQFTGMLTNYSYGTNGSGGTITAPTTAAQNMSANAGIMQLVPAWAFFSNNNVSNGLMYYGYINEWSVQYTHFTQFNVPMRCVISVNWTMLPTPASAPPSDPNAQAPGFGVLPTPTGTATVTTGPLSGFTTATTPAGIGGR